MSEAERIKQRERELRAAEPPCIGLDPDTDPCPFCGATMCEPCKHKPEKAESK